MFTIKDYIELGKIAYRHKFGADPDRLNLTKKESDAFLLLPHAELGDDLLIALERKDDKEITFFGTVLHSIYPNLFGMTAMWDCAYFCIRGHAGEIVHEDILEGCFKYAHSHQIRSGSFINKLS